MAMSKERHWFLTLWLVLMLLANLAAAFTNFTGAAAMREAYPNAPGWSITVLGVLALLNVVGVAALFLWKKWGFWLFCLSGLAAAGINLFVVGLGAGLSLFGLAGLVVLFIALQVGGERKGWPQLD
jgi:peptidoglycan/LPS O-acetylase OafA/YrhL